MPADTHVYTRRQLSWDIAASDPMCAPMCVCHTSADVRMNRVWGQAKESSGQLTDTHIFYLCCPVGDGTATAGGLRHRGHAVPSSHPADGRKAHVAVGAAACPEPASEREPLGPVHATQLSSHAGGVGAGGLLVSHVPIATAGLAWLVKPEWSRLQLPSRASCRRQVRVT